MQLGGVNVLHNLHVFHCFVLCVIKKKGFQNLNKIWHHVSCWEEYWFLVAKPWLTWITQALKKSHSETSENLVLEGTNILGKWNMATSLMIKFCFLVSLQFSQSRIENAMHHLCKSVKAKKRCIVKRPCSGAVLCPSYRMPY